LSKNADATHESVQPRLGYWFLILWRPKMRAYGVIIVLAFLPVWAAAHEKADEKGAKPLTPEAAAKKIDQQCTVEMMVKSTGKSRGVFFLNSKEDYKDADNFTVFINKVGVEKLKEAKIEDPSTHFKNKTIRVMGVVKLYRNKPEIVVEKADQIQVLEKKEVSPVPKQDPMPSR
jgi:hypothetical protein